MQGQSPSSTVETLLSATSQSMTEITRFETQLRERIISAFASTPAWWRQCVPGDAKAKAPERRERDRESGFAPRLHYHQIYYCYLEDLKLIITSKRNRPLFSASSAEDLSVRLSELVALRNRAAHGRLLTPSERDRVVALISELSVALGLNADLAALTLEDPVSLISDALGYIDVIVAASKSGDCPPDPLALEALRDSAALDARLDPALSGRLAEAIERVRAWRARACLAGHRLELMKAASVFLEQWPAGEIRSRLASLQ